jgi:hypothetical protein
MSGLAAMPAPDTPLTTESLVNPALPMCNSNHRWSSLYRGDCSRWLRKTVTPCHCRKHGCTAQKKNPKCGGFGDHHLRTFEKYRARNNSHSPFPGRVKSNRGDKHADDQRPGHHNEPQFEVNEEFRGLVNRTSTYHVSSPHQLLGQIDTVFETPLHALATVCLLVQSTSCTQKFGNDAEGSFAAFVHFEFLEDL